MSGYPWPLWSAPSRYFGQRVDLGHELIDAMSPRTCKTACTAGWDPMDVTETNAAVLVMAPTLVVCHYLADIANIACCLPGVHTVRVGEEQTLIVRYAGAARRTARIVPARFRIDHHAQWTEWEISGSAFYSGTIHIYGDSNLSQLQSILRTDQSAASGAAHDLHVDTLSRIARAVERGLDTAAAPDADPPPTPAAAHLAVVSAPPDAGQGAGQAGTRAHRGGLTRGLHG